jgi:pimeloyl-ACP methyl ester carboxylesterase
VLHYKTYCHSNAHKPWVTFVHGAGGSSSIWFRQIRDFKEHFNVLLVDLRGHGNSKHHLQKNYFPTYTFKDISEEVIEVLDHLEISKSHFVGISLGTIIIRELAENHPNRVAKMIMGGAVVKLNGRGQLLMRLGVMFKSVIPYILLYKLFAWAILPKRNHRESRSLFVREAKKLYQKEFERWFKLAAEINPLLRAHRENLTDHLTLFIMGEEDHMFLPAIRKLVDLSKDQKAQLQVIPSCGHVVNVEQPLIFNRSVINFLER